MRINLGTGYLLVVGAVTVDKRAETRPDVVHDLDVLPWPFENDSAEEIVASDIFEHLEDVIAAMDECWRILQRGGQLIVRGPIPDSPTLWDDVTHRRAFTLRSFDHFDWGTMYGAKYRYGKRSWRVVSREIDPQDRNAVLITLEKPA